MDLDIPYMATIKNLPGILDSIQKAAVPDAFGIDFLKDLGYTSSNDRSVIKVLKYMGLLDGSGRPQASYREFLDHTKSKRVLAARLRAAYDDLFKADRDAHNKQASELKGWFRTKTGVGDAVAEKMATTFRALASYADFSGPVHASEALPSPASPLPAEKAREPAKKGGPLAQEFGLGLAYRIEIHLPDTTNIDTFRAIFRALREELL